MGDFLKWEIFLQNRLLLKNKVPTLTRFRCKYLISLVQTARIIALLFHDSTTSRSFPQQQSYIAKPDGSFYILSVCNFRSYLALQAVMRNLVRRYVTQEQRKAENEGVTEDDVNEIKNDISAFRFELIEIMRSSGMNTSSATGPNGKNLYIENVRYNSNSFWEKNVMVIGL